MTDENHVFGDVDLPIKSPNLSSQVSSGVTSQTSAQEIEKIFRVSLDMLCITDAQGNFLQVSKAWEHVLGYTEADLLYKNFRDYIHPEDQPAMRYDFAGLDGENRVLNFVNRYQASNASWHYIEWRVQLEDNCLYIAGRDITDLKLAEDARIEQTRLLEYRQTFEEILTSISARFIHLPVAELDNEINNALRLIGELEKADRSYVFIINKGLARMSNTHEWCAQGIEPQIENLQDLPTNIFPWWMMKLEKFEEVYIPVVPEMSADAQVEQAALEEQGIQSVLVIPLVSDHTLIGFLGFDSVMCQRYWSKDSILLVKMVGDILSNALVRARMQAELVKSEIRNTALLSAVPDVIIRLRRDGVFLDFNSSMQNFATLLPEQMIGANIASFVTESGKTQAMQCIEDALRTKEIQTMEYTNKTGDSWRVFEARFKDSGPDEVTAIIRDISDRARLEQMKSDFINRATHELRTPIATMLLMANLIDGGVNAEEYKEYWGVLKEELNRERMLVEDLLSAGRLESNQAHLQFRYINLADVIKKVIHQFGPAAKEKNIELSLHILDVHDPSSYMVNADESALSQVFVNLLGNAIKFTQANGLVNVFVKRQIAGVEFLIVDNGIGIPSEDIPLLFNRFFRGSNAISDEIPGTGIGLFIVRSILEKHGGSIKVQSEPGKGATFVVWLPLDQK